MVTLKEIITAINERLIAIAPDVEIQSNDISEGYQTPSFFVELEDVRSAQYGSWGRERSIPVVIYYFPTERQHKQIELLDMQEKLEQGFIKPFEIMKGFTVFPSELNATKTDGVLQFSFDLYTLEYDLTETGEDITELHLNIEKRD
ncbi:phage tail terminator family protein [Paenibacillus solani]|uniref:Uncharacterized protein n=1 Tax=Paenibacillus solani TaxID=1705565 RepID=A0A0M1P2R5_9BACL|nr:hypothetical protein [Paenibacillus solani]KOR88776.1 hypothetical protein AM231_06115 [Paenibacillus solani]